MKAPKKSLFPYLVDYDKRRGCLQNFWTLFEAGRLTNFNHFQQVISLFLHKTKTKREG